MTNRDRLKKELEYHADKIVENGKAVESELQSLIDKLEKEEIRENRAEKARPAIWLFALIFLWLAVLWTRAVFGEDRIVKKPGAYFVYGENPAKSNSDNVKR